MKMKKMNEYKVDVVAGTITLTKKFAKAAGVLGTREFNTFKQLRADYPDYAVQVREIAKKENKTSYANLTYDFMKTYIRTIEGETSENQEFLLLSVSSSLLGCLDWERLCGLPGLKA